MSKNVMRAYYSFITVLKAENIEKYLKAKFSGKYEESAFDIYPFRNRLTLNSPNDEETRKEKKYVQDLKTYYVKAKKCSDPELIKVEFLTSSQPNYAVLVSTYGIKNYEDFEIKDAAEKINNRVWSGRISGSDGYDSVVSASLRFLLGSLDNKEMEGRSSSKQSVTELSIIVPSSSCCTEKRLDPNWSNNTFLWEKDGDGSSFVFIYFSAAMGEDGNEFFKEENSLEQSEIISLIQQATAGEQKKHAPDPRLRKDFKDVLTYSHPWGASIIKAGHIYSPYNNKNKTWVRSLSFEEYFKYYTCFISVLFSKVLFSLNERSLRKEWNDKKNEDLTTKADDLFEDAEEIEDLVSDPGITDDSEGIAKNWLKMTETKRLVDKSKKLYNGIKEYRKEKEKDTTEAIFSIFTACALVSCFWDAYCLFAEKNMIALGIGGVVAFFVFLVFSIILKKTWKTIWFYIKKAKILRAALVIYLAIIILLMMYGCIEPYKTAQLCC